MLRAVQHAHQKGIIHRDIKPNNVLVTIADGRPIPKVIDFGIAKAMTQRLTDKTVFTEFRQLIGTPEYMSPEQAELTGVDIDTRSDIYALGVLLYQLLTGTTPIDSHRLRSAAIEELKRIIREEDPPRPSTRWQTMMETTGSEPHEGVIRSDVHRNRATSVTVQEMAKSRRTDPATLRRLLRGDLDWIVMKALDKDRTRRYETAFSLASDLKRYLEQEPVLASPPTLRYRAGKFVRRNRTFVVACLTVATVLIAGLGGTMWGMVDAQRSARRSQTMMDFMQDVLGKPAPGRDGSDVRLLDVLYDATDSIPQRFGDDPLQEAMARAMLGTVFHQQSQHRIAIEQFEVAYRIRHDHLGDDHDLTLKSGWQLLAAYSDGRRMDHVERFGKEIVPVLERSLGSTHEYVLDGRNILCTVRLERRQHAAARAELKDLLAETREAHGDAHRVTLNVALALADAAGRLSYEVDGEHRREILLDTRDILREITDARLDAYEAENIGTLGALGALANIQSRLGDKTDAIQTNLQVIHGSEGVIEDSHWLRANQLIQLGRDHYAIGSVREAAEWWARGIDAMRSKRGDTDPITLSNISDSLPVFLEANRSDVGVTYARVLVDVFKPGSGHVGGELYNVYLARFLSRQEQLDEATLLIESMLENDADAMALDVMTLLHLTAGEHAMGRRDFETAESHLLRAWDTLEREGEFYHARTADALKLLIAFYEHMDRTAEADRWRSRLRVQQPRDWMR